MTSSRLSWVVRFPSHPATAEEGYVSYEFAEEIYIAWVNGEIQIVLQLLGPILSQFFADWCDIWDKTCRFVTKFWAIFSSCIHDGLIPPITRDPKAMVWANHWVLVLGFWGLGMGVCPVSSLLPMCSSPFFGCFGALPNMLKASLQIPMAQWIPHNMWINQWESKKSPTQSSALLNKSPWKLMILISIRN